MMLTPAQLANLTVNALSDKKAHDIKLLRTTDVTTLADYFVICTAGSWVHMKTLSDYLEAELKKADEFPHRREGERNNDWMLIDYGCVVVHIFLERGREFYKLERLWSDAEDIDLQGLGAKAREYGTRGRKV